MKNRKINDQVEQGCCLDFYGLEDLCDDPKRNETKQEVQAILTPMRSGFVLTARDGEQFYKIVDEYGRQIRKTSSTRERVRTFEALKPIKYTDRECSTSHHFIKNW